MAESKNNLLTQGLAGLVHFYIHVGKNKDFVMLKAGDEFWWVKWHFNNIMEKANPTVYVP
jgi:hypothetical protein